MNTRTKRHQNTIVIVIALALMFLGISMTIDAGIAEVDRSPRMPSVEQLPPKRMEVLPPPQNTVGTQPGALSATVTAYSEKETCPNRSCVMASGKLAYDGAVACPRALKLGTKVQIAGETYTCEDRTAQRYDGRFDLWTGYGEEAHDAALQYGLQTHSVLVL